MSILPSVRPTLNLQFDKQPTPEAILSHLKSVGATFDRGSEASETATYVDSKGNVVLCPANYPRPYFDWDTKEHFGLLIEETRTNLLDYSDDMSQSNTFLDGVAVETITANYDENSPIKYRDPDRIQLTANGGNLAFRFGSFSTTSGNKYSVQFWLKSYSGNPVIDLVRISLDDGSESDTVASSITIPSEWTLFEYTIDRNSTGSGYSLQFRINEDADFSIAGMQVEQGSSCSSLIPTTGTTKLRNTEVCKIDGTAFTDFYNQNEGTWFAFVNPGKSLNGTILDADSQSVDRFPQLGIVTSAAIQSSFDNYNQYSVSTINANDNIKLAVTVKDGEQRNFYDGEFKEQTTEPNPADLNALYIGDRDVGGSSINSFIKRLLYFPKALTDTELENLTRNL